MYYNGKVYEVRRFKDLTLIQVVIWQGTEITAESGSRHEFYATKGR